MPTSYTSLLGLALPVTGELSGTWGDTVNSYITQYVDAAVAGAQTISGTQTAVTLSVTNGSSLTQAGSGSSTGSAQYQIINCTGNPASALTVTVPSASKVYLVLNNTSTSQTVTVKGAATTGVTVAAARCALIAWNGTDFELVATDDASKMNGVLAAVNGGTGQSSYAVGDILYASTTTALSKLADVATGNALISGGVGVAPSYGKIGLTTHVSGTLPVANGGTGLTSGTSGGVLGFTATGTIASSAALAANAIVIGGGAGATPTTTTTGTGVLTAIGNAVNTTGGLVTQSGTLAASSLLLGGGASTAISSTTTGTGVVTALGTAVGSAGAFVVNGGALGTPSSGTVTNLTGTASININGTVGATTPNTGAFTSVTSTSASGILTRAAASQDGVELIGRAGGTLSYKVSVTPTTLTASRTVTLPDANIDFTTGLAVANGGTGATTAPNARTNLGATTVGGNFFTLTNPSAITFPRINADNTVSALDAATFRSAIGAGTGGGSVTSVSGTGTVSGISLSGTVTTSGSLTLGGTLDLSSPPAIGGTTPNTGAFTSVTSTSAAGVLTRAAATQDGVEMIGRAGGTLSYKVSLTPTTLTASRTLTLPDNSGTILTTGAAVTVAQGGTGITSGTSGGIPYFSSTSAITSSAALAANALVVGGGAGAAPATVTTGTGVVTALGVNTGSAGAFVVNGGALGTPSSGTLTNATGLPLTTGVTGTLPVANGGTGTSTAFTSGSVVFAGASGVYSQNNTNFFWDNSTSSLGIGTASPVGKLHLNVSSGAIYYRISSGLNAMIMGGLAGASGEVSSNGDLVFGAGTSFAERGRYSSDGTFRVKGAGTAGSTDAFQVSGSAPASSLAVTAAGYTQPKAYADTVVAAGNTGTALTLTCTNGNVFTATLTGNATITLSSPIATGATSITLILTNDATAGRTVAWAGGSFKFPGGAASLSRTTTANAVDIWVFFTPDGGTTWYGNIAMKNMTA